MPYNIVGLGNPGEEYKNTRHNTGKIILDSIQKNFKMTEWKDDKKISAQSSKGEIGGTKVLLLFPQTFMNKSGNTLKTSITSEKKAKSLIVIHDDIDLPIGSMKIVFNRGSGGHRGVESIIRTIKTEAFIRIKIGISPTTPSGKLKKPKGGEAVEKLILGEFKKPELETLKNISKKVNEAVLMIISENVQNAMTQYN